MIKYTDIQVSTAKMLKNIFPQIDIYVDENKKEITKPSFYIQIVPLRNNSTISDKRFKLTDMYITYIKKGITNAKKLDILDDLIESFEGIDILDLNDKNLERTIRYLPILDKTIINSDDNMPTLKLTFKYYDDRRQPITDNPSRYFEDYMRIINLKINTNGSISNHEIKEDN